jgi:hypothetical protein
MHNNTINILYDFVLVGLVQLMFNKIVFII